MSPSRAAERAVLAVSPLRELLLDGAGDGPAHVAAASGLVHSGEHLYVVADDELALAEFPAAGDAPGRLLRVPRASELPQRAAERKRHKPDFEALVALERPRALLAVGSGSTELRRRGLLWGLDDAGRVTGDPGWVELDGLYDRLESELPELNLEGAAVLGGQLVLLQRGNGTAGVNAIVSLELGAVNEGLRADPPQIPAAALADVRRLELGVVGQVRLAFSDLAALPDGRAVFAAAAEDVHDVYADGGCEGSVVGVLGPDGELERVETLEGMAKVEGLAARLEGETIELLMVADADDRSRPAPLLAATLQP